MRVLVSLIGLWAVFFMGMCNAYGQTVPERTRIGESSVTYIEPEGLRKKTDPAVLEPYFAPAFRVLEEPKSFVKIWTPRLSHKKTAKAFAKENGSKFKEMLELDIDGQRVPMVITYVKSRLKSGHVYKALFDAEHSILVAATIFDDAPITRDEVLDAFKTIRIDVQNPVGNFDGARFTVDLVQPFEFVFSDDNNLFIKSYPEIDKSYRQPSVSVGYQNIFIYDGKPVIDSLETASKHIFPADRENCFLDEKLDFSNVKFVSQGYENIGPGKSYRTEVTYKDRMCIQYIWDIAGKSQFEEYLFFFAMGDKEHLEPIKNNLSKMAASLKVKDRP